MNEFLKICDINIYRFSKMRSFIWNKIVCSVCLIFSCDFYWSVSFFNSLCYNMLCLIHFVNANLTLNQNAIWIFAFVKQLKHTHTHTNFIEFTAMWMMVMSTCKQCTYEMWNIRWKFKFLWSQRTSNKLLLINGLHLNAIHVIIRGCSLLTNCFLFAFGSSFL